jgi:DNA primase
MQSPWEEIKSRVSILDVVSEYADIKQVGSSYKIICPFHNDKNPSLVLSPEKSLWHCFGCGVGGDMFKFVEEIENITRKEALEKLARKAGIKLEKQLPVTPEKAEEIKHQKSRQESGFEYLEWASNIYHKLLKKMLVERKHPVAEYIMKRGLSAQTIDKFKIGYAPNGNFLLNLANKYKLNQGFLQEVGLLKKKENGDYKDAFSDRIMIPIADLEGRAVGFTGRVLPYDKTERPKYLNTSQTAWFDKSKIWFGWPQHNKSIRRQRRVLMLEGNMDVISSDQYGIDIGLASQGTAVTATHLRTLKYLTKNIILAFDNDTAGIAAGEKVFKEAIKAGFEVAKLEIPPDYKDLDEWLQNESDKFANGLPVTSIVGFLDSTISHNQMTLRSSELGEQRKGIDHIMSLLVVCDELTQEHYLNILSKITGKRASTLGNILAKLIQHQPKSLTSDQDDLSPQLPTKSDPQLDSAYSSWFNLVSLSFASTLEENIFLALFPAIKQIFPKLNGFDSVQEFVSANTESIQLVKDNLDPQELVRQLVFLKQYLSSNFKNIIWTEKSLQAYQMLQVYEVETKEV